MTSMASADRYAARTLSITFGSVGAESAASAAPKDSEMASQRNISENLECDRFELAGEHIAHANFPSSGGIVDGNGKDFRRIAAGRQHVTGVIRDDLSGWIHYIDVKHMLRGG